MDILLVEDDDVDVEALTRAFERSALPRPRHVGHDGREALESIRGLCEAGELSRRFMILLDLNMVGMNGMEFLDELRQDSSVSDALVFVLTTSSDERDLNEAYKRSVAGYIVKSQVGSRYEALVDLISSYDRAVEFPLVHCPPA